MCNNRERYNREREKRWWMAKIGEKPAIEALVRKINNKFNKKIVPKRYDDIWFKEYDPNIIEWVRGCSDFCLDITVGANNHIYIYTEVKIKNTEFDGTVYGKVLRNGEKMSNYGCKSFYLDIDPVHKHMNEFCDIANIDKNTFVIMFADSNFNSIRVISLEEVNQLINNGWNKQPISKFGRGYGKRSYLIPVNATHRIEDLTGEQIIKYASTRLSKPE